VVDIYHTQPGDQEWSPSLLANRDVGGRPSSPFAKASGDMPVAAMFRKLLARVTQYTD
jgi:hypothetical protein